MLLIYTHKITPRLNYIFKHFFGRILNIQITFTTKVDEFVAHNGPKITYSKAPLGTEFFIRSHDLLFEQGINDIDIKIYNWDDEFGSNTVEVHISAIRRKLGKELIKTIRGIGYIVEREA